MVAGQKSATERSPIDTRGKQDRVGERRLNAQRGELAFEKIGEMRQTFGELAAALASSYEADVEARENARMLRERCRQRFSAAHLMMHPGQYVPGTFAVRRLHEEAQRMINVLAGMEHD